MEVSRSRQLKAGIFAQLEAPTIGLATHQPRPTPDSLHPLRPCLQEGRAGPSSGPGPSDDAGPSTSGRGPSGEADAQAVGQLLEQARQGVGHIKERVATPHIAALRTWQGVLVEKMMAAAAELDLRGEEKTASAVAKDKAILVEAIGQLPDGPEKAALQAILRSTDTVVPPRAFALASPCDPYEPLLLYKCAGMDNSGYAPVQDAFAKGIRTLGFGAMSYHYGIRDLDLAPQRAGAPHAGGRGPAGGRRGAAGEPPWVWNRAAEAAKAAAAAAKPPSRYRIARSSCCAVQKAALKSLKDAGLENALCHYEKAALCRVEPGQTYCNATLALITAGTLAVSGSSLLDTDGRQAGAEGGQACCAPLRS